MCQLLQNRNLYPFNFSSRTIENTTNNFKKHANVMLCNYQSSGVQEGIGAADLPAAWETPPPEGTPPRIPHTPFQLPPARLPTPSWISTSNRERTDCCACRPLSNRHFGSLQLSLQARMARVLALPHPVHEKRLWLVVPLIIWLGTVARS